MNGTVLAVIPARGGSKRVPRKNVRSVGGRALLSWTIEQARDAKSLTQIVVSSDDDEILKVAARDAMLMGAKIETIKRPANLAGDLVSASAVVMHALSLYKADYVVLLQPTSPLRTTDDIENAIRVCRSYHAPCVSVSPVDVKPESLCTIDRDGRLRRLLNDCPPSYRINGAVYVAPAGQFREQGDFIDATTTTHVMPAARSLDIDTEEDMEKAHKALERRLYEMVM